MRLVSVNVGKKQTQLKGDELETTGIYKLPAAGIVEIGVHGLTGDVICDQESHGGPDQAVYVYGTTDYSWWGAHLGTAIESGTFGENLTISDFESANMSVGDRLQVGAVLLEVTAPRIPCSTLAARMRDPGFVKRYRYGERPGLYCRVIEAGAVQAGDEVMRLPYGGETVSILEMFRNHYRRTKDEATLRRFLRVPISIRARVAAERDLRKIAAAAIQ
jgi:MOSC domain-containing protein YiiM